MSYLYQTVNKSDFCQAFTRMGRQEQFSYEGRCALFDYLENLAEDTQQPMELDIIALCCDFSEYASLEEFNEERGSDYETWEEVAEETTVIEHSGDAAIVQAF